MPRRVDAPPAGRLFQERLWRRPFWMLLACLLVNQTTWAQAEPAFAELRRRYGSVRRIATAAPEDLHELMRPLGLWRRRSLIIVRLANAWLRSRPKSYDDVLALPGCGKYAADSWAIFVEGRLDVEPDDGKLNWYVDRQRRAA